MGVADQFRELGESADVRDLRENHIQRCLPVIDEGLARCRVLWLCFNRCMIHVTCLILCVLSFAYTFHVVEC
jgi:hypothetical protein